MFASIVLVGLCAASAQSMLATVDKDMMTHLLNYNLCASCWGEDYALEYKKSVMAACEKCGGAPDMATAGSVISYPAAALRKVMPMPLYNYNSFAYPMNMHYGRKKRMALDSNLVEEFHEDMETMVGNFTCVMKELGFLTATGEISPEMTQGNSGMFTSGDKAGSDPVFVQKLATEMADCATLSRSVPQQILNKNPFFQKYGRMAIFFKCIKQAERECCAKYTVANLMEKMGMQIDTTGFADKYDAACMAAKIMKHHQTPEMEHIADYVWGDEM